MPTPENQRRGSNHITTGRPAVTPLDTREGCANGSGRRGRRLPAFFKAIEKNSLPRPSWSPPGSLIMLLLVHLVFLVTPQGFDPRIEDSPMLFPFIARDPIR